MNYKKLKAACYMTNCTMAVTANLSPLLFLTFNKMYGVSYTLLGSLVLVNFCTQLGIDLIFSFFSKKFNIPKTVKMMPVISFVGLILFAVSPWIFKGSVYVGLVLGTVIFSVAAGLSEVLNSPTVAAIPSDNPDREMSKLHSIYAWGVVAMVILSTLFLNFVGREYWQWLPIAFSLVPLTAAILFSTCGEIPVLPEGDDQNRKSGLKDQIKHGLLLFVFAIFLGGASECNMAQWASGYIEGVLGLPKAVGDILGVAMFAAALGLGRSLYAKFGKKISTVMVCGFIGAAVCYLTAALCNIPVIGLAACAMTGFCASMLWPGSLIWVAEALPFCGVTVYALMAAGGDLGGALGSQLVGVITDGVAAMPRAAELALSMGITPEQLGMKAGMIFSAVFPIIGAALCLVIMKKIFSPRPRHLGAEK